MIHLAHNVQPPKPRKPFTHLESACTETFHDVERMIHLVINKHIIKHGGDREELEGEAHLAFMLAYCSYQPCKAAFTTWVWLKVWGRLMDGKKKISRQAARGHLPGPLPDEPSCCPEYEFDQQSVLERLKPEGRALVRLVLAAPGELAEVMAGACFDAVAARKALRLYLREHMGWTYREIVSGFRDVREVLGWNEDADEFVVEPRRQLQFVSYGPNGREW